MHSLPRLAALVSLRSYLCAALAAHLIYTPLFSLPAVQAEASKSSLPALALPTITAPHQAGELLIKFRADAPEAQRQQVIERLAADSKPLRGASGLTRLKLKSGADHPTSLALLQSLEGLV